MKREGDDSDLGIGIDELELEGLGLEPRARARARSLAFASVALCALLLCLPPLSSFGDPGKIESPSDFATGMMAAHNQVRRETPAGDAELPPLTWSSSLARDAREVAAECRFEHSYGPHGENLYARAAPRSPQSVVQAWAGEVDDWSLSSNACAQGKKCGHYTQLVWRQTRSVGCAVQRCDSDSPFSGWDEWVLWVCHYDPPGNIRGRSPY